MIFLDAFSSRYLNPQNAPFLSRISQSGFYAPLKPLPGSQEIGAALFSGTLPNTNNFWWDYVLRSEPHRSSFLFKRLLWLCDLIPNDIANQYARYIVYKLFGCNPGTPNLIPSKLLDFFELKQGKRYGEEKPLGEIVTLFDELREYEVKYAIYGLYESIFEKRIIKNALSAMRKDYGLILFKLGSLDRLGHKYGPESDEVRKKVKEIDNVLQAIMEGEGSHSRKTYYVIFSDHGMTRVTKGINLTKMLEELPLKVPSDFLFFLNSTVASFWFNNQEAQKLIVEKLGEVDFGQILNESKLKLLGIDKLGREHGDLFFALKEGYVFFPDFFRRRVPPKGMHGYAFPTYDSPILVIYPNISRSSSSKEYEEFINIMPTVLDLMGLPIPSTCEGKSINKSQSK